jgi:hypothetical protein
MNHRFGDEHVSFEWSPAGRVYHYFLELRGALFEPTIIKQHVTRLVTEILQFSLAGASFGYNLKVSSADPIPIDALKDALMDHVRDYSRCATPGRAVLTDSRRASHSVRLGDSRDKLLDLTVPLSEVKRLAAAPVPKVYMRADGPGEDLIPPKSGWIRYTNAQGVWVIVPDTLSAQRRDALMAWLREKPAAAPEPAGINIVTVDRGAGIRIPTGG